MTALTVSGAAARARTSSENVRDALNSGDLRNLQAASIDAWARARIATRVTSTMTPRGDR